MSAENHAIPRTAMETTKENPWPVRHFSQVMHDVVERWPALWLEGQIAEINTRRSGSAYITLKDMDFDISMSVVGFGLFATKATQYNQGDHVVVHGRANIWQKQTRLSIQCDDISKVGSGNLTEQIEELRKKLKGEGLFDIENKIPLPRFPHKIGLICAPQARAEGDVVMNARLRWPTIEFAIEHVHVQGPLCPPEVVEAIENLDRRPDVDVIIVARGGGSFEDLLGFSDERVVRATAACITPIVSAIGHEDDQTLIELAADVRASTPTDAAKRVVPDVMEETRFITEQETYIHTVMRTLMTRETQFLQGWIQRPSLLHPETLTERPQMLLHTMKEHLDNSMRRLIDGESMEIEKRVATLHALSPYATLRRGFSIAQTQDGTIIRSITDISPDDAIMIRVEDGIIDGIVTSANPYTKEEQI